MRNADLIRTVTKKTWIDFKLMIFIDQVNALILRLLLYLWNKKAFKRNVIVWISRNDGHS